MSYIGKAPGFGIRNRYYYTATASQTTFSGADDNGQTLAYADSKYLDVYLNGVLLVAGTDYTATTLTSVTLTSGAAASDIVEIVAYDIFSVADTVSAANGGTFSNDIDVTGTVTSDGADLDGAVVINESGADVDFRVESDTVTNALFVEGSSGNVGIGTSSPANPLQVEKSSTDTTITNAQNSNALKLSNYQGGANGQFSSLGFSVAAVSGASADAVIAGFAESAGNSSLRLYTESSNVLSERMRIDSSGNVGIGTTSPSRPLDVHKTGSGSCAFVDDSGTVASNHTTLDVRFDGDGSPATGATYIRFGDQDSNNGSITVNGGSVAYNTSSDYRKKENIVDLTDGIDRVKQLDVHRFNWIGRDEIVDGFLAHEVQTVVPEAVTGTKDEVEAIGNVTDAEGVVVQENVTEPSELPEDQTWTKTGDRPVYQGIDQAKLVPLLTAALQEAIGRIETLEAEVAALKGESN